MRWKTLVLIYNLKFSTVLLQFWMIGIGTFILKLSIKYEDDLFLVIMLSNYN